MSDVLTTTGRLAAAAATNPVDAERWQETGRRRRLLSGEWVEDLRVYMSAHVDAARLDAWGPPNTTMNLYKSLVEQVAIVHDGEGTIDCEGASDEQVGQMLRLVHWSRLQAHEINVVGLRDALVRVEHSPTAPDGGVVTRLVTPDVVEVEVDPSVPTRIVVVREARPRRIGAEIAWCWDEFSIADPQKPYYRVRTMAEPSVDVSADVLGAAAGTYPWVDDGEPYLPWVVAHARDTGETWDYRYWHELAQATYAIALCWTFWMHALKEASWDQKYAIDLVLQGLSAKGQGNARRSKVTVDPTSLLMFRSPGDGRGTVGSIGASIDPLRMAESISLYMEIAATNLGLSPADMQAKASPQSGIAIAISREGVRKMARRLAPVLRAADVELCETIARVHNTFAPATYPRLPVTGWSVTYPALPLSADEIDAMLDRNERLLAAGLRSEVDVLIEMEPGLTREKAMERLLAVRRERAELAATGTGGARPAEKPSPT